MRVGINKNNKDRIYVQFVGGFQRTRERCFEWNLVNFECDGKINANLSEVTFKRDVDFSSAMKCVAPALSVKWALVMSSNPVILSHT